jgi:hypothetical protein
MMNELGKCILLRFRLAIAIAIAIAIAATHY